MSDVKNWTFDEVDALYRRFNPNDFDGEGRRVVIAEDTAPILTLLCNSLERKGFSVTGTGDGLAALKLIRDTRPDLCLLDINLPKISGLDILEAMRRDERYAKIPVAIVTARKEKRDIVMATKLGVCGYFIKPFKIEDILKRVQEIFPPSKPGATPTPPPADTPPAAPDAPPPPAAP